MTPSIAIRVMHAPWAPERRQLLIDLKLRLGAVASPHSFAVVKDDRHEGVWPTARRAWIAASTAGTSHAYVMQDDTLPCRHFLETLAYLVSLRPTAPLVLATSRPIVETVAGAWMAAPDGMWGGATVLPVAMAHDFLGWNARHFPSPPYDILDDYRLMLYFTAHGITSFYPVPGLVQHCGRTSLLGHNANDPQMKPRRFIGWDADPRQVDWLAGFDTPVIAPRGPYAARFTRDLTPVVAAASGLGQALGLGGRHGQ